MKSDGVEDIFKWMETMCKIQKEQVNIAERNVEKAIKNCCCNSMQSMIDDAQIEVKLAQERLDAYVRVKRGCEKYMKKLRYCGE